MKKKLAFICASILSGSVLASAVTGTTVSIPPLSHGAPNQTGWINTNHAYSIQNDSGVAQNVAVCMTTTLCYNAAPQYKKIIQSCDRFLLQPNEFKHSVNNTTLQYNYPFTGY